MSHPKNTAISINIVNVVQDVSRDALSNIMPIIISNEIV